jgi:hypothetical protein
MEDSATWIRAQFEGATLRDVRRVRRAIQVATAMVEAPGASLPRLAPTRSDLKATYALWAHPLSTPEHLQAGHRAHVHAALHDAAAPAPVLLVEDTTVMSWAGKAPVRGLGPIGSGGDAALQGVLLHSVVALRWTAAPDPATPCRPAVAVLGVAAQQYHVRTPAPPTERALPAGSRPFARQQRWRESALWAQSTALLGPAPAPGVGPRWVRVCDRGADVYEFLEGCQAAGHGYVVRAYVNRALVDGRRLLATLRTQAPQATLTLPLRARPRHAARVATLHVAATAVTVRAPRRPGHPPGRRPGLAVTALRVWEPAPPAGVAALEWLLVSDAPVAAAADAITLVQQYATRWVIEEFHKVLKTGLGAERLQLEDAARLFAAIAVMCVVAVRLLHLKEWVRTAPEAPADAAGLTPLEYRLLLLHAKRPLATVRDVALALGRLGGHLNRTGDGLPGWRSLWHGMQRLRAMAEGAALVLKGQESFG